MNVSWDNSQCWNPESLVLSLWEVKIKRLLNQGYLLCKNDLRVKNAEWKLYFVQKLINSSSLYYSYWIKYRNIPKNNVLIYIYTTCIYLIIKRLFDWEWIKKPRYYIVLWNYAKEKGLSKFLYLVPIMENFR